VRLAQIEGRRADQVADILDEQQSAGRQRERIAFGAITPYGEVPKGADDGTYGTYPEPATFPEPTPPAVEPVHPILAWTIGQRNIAVKCDLCHFRPEGPECIRVCPTKALHMVEPEDINDLIAKRRLASGLGLMAKD
jgi:hydrogenase-4 component A